MEDWMNKPSIMISAILAVVLIIVLIGMIRLNRKLKRLRKQYTEFMGNTGVANLEDVISDMKHKMNEQHRYTEKLEKQVADMTRIIPKLKSRVGAVRYNAFSDGGNDLSFSIAIMNDEKDGVVFSGFHSRDSTYVFEKPVEQGAYSYTLTPEELEAIEIAK